MKTKFLSVSFSSFKFYSLCTSPLNLVPRLPCLDVYVTQKRSVLRCVCTSQNILISIGLNSWFWIQLIHNLRITTVFEKISMTIHEKSWGPWELSRGVLRMNNKTKIVCVKTWLNIFGSPDMLSCFRRWSLITFLLIPLKRENKLKVVPPTAYLASSHTWEGCLCLIPPFLPPTKCFQDIHSYQIQPALINLSFLVVSNSH